MGVEGLLRVLKEILDERQVGYITNLYARARGKRLAIDGHGFLHRLVVIPKFAHALLFNEDYSGPAKLFAFWCRTMKEQGVDLRVVFDGDVTPGKAVMLPAEEAPHLECLQRQAAQILERAPSAGGQE